MYVVILLSTALSVCGLECRPYVLLTQVNVILGRDFLYNNRSATEDTAFVPEKHFASSKFEK